MEGYRLVGIHVGAPTFPVEVKNGQLVEATSGVSGQHIHKGEFPEFSPTSVSMPVGTIFLNYVPDRERYYDVSGTLYCLVPEWQIVGIMEGTKHDKA